MFYKTICNLSSYFNSAHVYIVRDGKTYVFVGAHVKHV